MRGADKETDIQSMIDKWYIKALLYTVQNINQALELQVTN